MSISSSEFANSKLASSEFSSSKLSGSEFPDSPLESSSLGLLEKSNRHEQLVQLLTNVKLQGYKFITVTPRTHQHFLSRAGFISTKFPKADFSKLDPSKLDPSKLDHPKAALGKNLRDIFGWGLPFTANTLCPMLHRIVNEAELIEQEGDLLRSKVRISSLGNDLFLHSQFPTTGEDSVFFGPDTYRFARFIRHSLEKDQGLHQRAVESFTKPFHILDIGCGAGAGGIAVVRALPQGLSYILAMNDINRRALDLMAVNAQVAEIPVRPMEGDIFENINEKYDLIVANPPYMKDESGRAYRDGGEQLGLDLSVRIFQTAFEHLAPGGQLLLYTGVAMTSQSDPFLSIIKPLLASANCTWSYEEIDPDVFGEELEMPAYASAHRIAAVGLTVRRN